MEPYTRYDVPILHTSQKTLLIKCIMMKAHKYILSILAILFSQLLYASPDRLPSSGSGPSTSDYVVAVLMLIVALPLAIGFLWNTLKGKVEGKKTDGEDKTMIWLCLLLVIGVILVGIAKCS